MDIWTGFCMTMICLAVLESATIAFMLQNEKCNFSWEKGHPIGPLSNGIELGIKENLRNDSGNGKSEVDETRKEKLLKKIQRIDNISKIVFPLCLMGFTVVYIIVYVAFEQQSFLRSSSI
jgi:hypothetical protein